MKNRFLARIWVLLLALLLAILPYTACAGEGEIVWQGEETFLPAWDGDSQSLFAGYVHSLFYGTEKQSRSSATAGSLLTGNNAVLYNEIKPYILELADGTRSSTEITYSPAIFGVEGNYWTAEELGIEAIVSGGMITNEAAQAIQNKFHTDFDLVLEALLRDCAYEMFWYDKTQSTIRTTFNFRAISSGGVIRMGWEGVYTLKFPVSEEYAAGDYSIDASAIARAKTAAANARAIVDKYAGASDLEKLNGYRQEICDLVSYNYEAAGNSDVAFGNPWQMIWVFDGDPATNVVCEGYSKAFQYLCEQTAFTGSISCILADGWMGSGSMEGHMWNVLRMDDGKNYIADITNCDAGHAGTPDLLFLSGYTDGSLEEGYIYSCHGTGIAYIYNDDTLALYPGSWLEMSPNGMGGSPPPRGITCAA